MGALEQTSSYHPARGHSENLDRKLKGYFQTRPDIRVVSRLAIFCEGIRAVIDHLVLTQYGIFVIGNQQHYEQLRTDMAGHWEATIEGSSWMSIQSPWGALSEQLQALQKYLSGKSSHVLESPLPLDEKIRAIDFERLTVVSNDAWVDRVHMSETVSRLFISEAFVCCVIEMKLEQQARWELGRPRLSIEELNQLETLLAAESMT